VLAAHAAASRRQPGGARARAKAAGEFARLAKRGRAQLSADRAWLATRLAVRVLRNATLRNAAFHFQGGCETRRFTLRNAAFHFQGGCETRRFTLRNAAFHETRRFTLRNAAFHETRRFAKFDLSFAKLCI